MIEVGLNLGDARELNLERSGLLLDPRAHLPDGLTVLVEHVDEPIELFASDVDAAAFRKASDAAFAGQEGQT